MYNRPIEPTIEWLHKKFAKAPAIAEGNAISLKAGYNYGNTTEIFTTSYRIEKAVLEEGKYRNITGNTAVAYGLISAANKAKKELFLGSYPITPASEILHTMSSLRNYNVKTFQAEDEIAGIASAIGAAYAGDHHIWSRHGTQNRIHRPGHHHRVAPGDHQCSAWRAFHRYAHQNGTIGSVPGSPWAE